MDSQTNILHCVWEVEQNILDVIHNICVENNLSYSLAYGTLLGAVRHKGFIPWDDDIDIIMPREDYKKFIEIWEKKLPTGFVLQNGDTDEDYVNNFIKIRKKNTTFVQYDWELLKNYHKGIFVDVFPGDIVAPKGLLRKIQYMACAINLLYSRGYTSGSKGIIGNIEKTLLKVSKPKQIKYRKMTEEIISKWNKKKKGDALYFFPSTLNECKIYLPGDIFDNKSSIEFNGKNYSCIKDVKQCLEIWYGNYMELPPEEKRTWYHHPIIVDVEHEYEEIKDKVIEKNEESFNISTSK